MRSAGKSDLAALKGARSARRGTLTVRWRDGEELLVAFAVPAKGTTAVARNRLRRQLRAILRRLEAEGARGTLLVSSSGREPQTSSDLERDLRGALQRLGALPRA